MVEKHLVGGNAASSADVIFLHGLEGDWYSTWASSCPEGSWPPWLAADIPGVAVWCVHYPSSATRWRGKSMPIRDRATSLLGTLSHAHGIGHKPFILIGHSLGGLLIKQIVRHSIIMDDQYGGFADRLAGVIFFSTPHTGSGLASLATYFKMIRATPLIRELAKDHSYLRELDDWYRNYAVRTNLPHLSFYEKQNTNGIRVVGESSGDPHLPGMTAIPVDANHRTICKFPDCDDPIYLQVRRFITTQRMRFIPEPIQPDRSGSGLLGDTGFAPTQNFNHPQSDTLEPTWRSAEAQRSRNRRHRGSNSSSRGIKARQINAHNVVQGVQVQGAPREIIDRVTQSIQKVQDGSIEADAISARSIVSGFQYLHSADVTEYDIRTGLQTLREELENLSASGSFADDRHGHKALYIVDEIGAELQAFSPDRNQIITKLRVLSDNLSCAATACDAVGKVSKSITRCASAADGLWHLAQRMFGM